MLEMQKRKLARQESILLSLKKLDYLSRSQIQQLHDLGGDRNARRILYALSEYVSAFRSDTGENIYYLNKAGRERVECNVVRQKTVQAGHYLMRNDVFLHYKENEDWKNEIKFTVDGVTTVIADAYYRYDRRRHFLEVDHLQHMSKNKDKIERYRLLQGSGVFQVKLKYFPRLVWVTLTETRRKQLLEWCAGMEAIVHLWDEIR